MIPLFCIEDRVAPFIEAFVSSASEQGFRPCVSTPATAACADFQKFREVYRHYSSNSEAFELACFRRYFEVARLAPSDGRFVIADSDLLVNAPPDEIPEIYLSSFNLLVGSIGYNAGAPEEDISPHFSFWTRSLLRHFIEFLISAYEHQRDEIKQIYDARLAARGSAAISDMTLLHMFVSQNSVPFLNSNRVNGTHFIDHNFSMAECENEIFRKEAGFKAFRRKGSHLELLTHQGRRIRPVVIHLQGRAKVAASSLMHRHDVTARLKLAALAAIRQARKFAK